MKKINPTLIQAVIAAEDKRFYSHFGIDPIALARAAWLNWRHGRIISGGSTISMQLARLNQGLAPGPRTYKRKIKEIWWTLLIERHNSKQRILSEYINRAPAGNLTIGFPAAAKLYLNKNIDKISYAEAAFLAGLPASPEPSIRIKALFPPLSGGRRYCIACPNSALSLKTLWPGP